MLIKTLEHVYESFLFSFPIGLKVIMSIICGGLIGLEREMKGKSAGLKTNILICLGATLYTTVSILITDSFSPDGTRADPARIAAQVVSGIGFLGAGAIMQSRTSIVGLTTAATIWVVAAIGVCIGTGYLVISFVFTMTVLFTLLAIDRLENVFLGRAASRGIEIVFEDHDGAVRSEINRIMSNDHIGLDDFDIARTGEFYTLHLQYSNSEEEHKRFILDLWTLKGIREVRQL